MKFSRLLLTGLLILCMGASSVSAQAFSKYSVTNPKGSTTFYGISNSKNVKIYDGKDWKYKVTYIYFSDSISGTEGLALAPMKKHKTGIYSLCGGKKGWAKSAMKSYQYKSWNSGCGAAGSYYLGVRLDTSVAFCK